MLLRVSVSVCVCNVCVSVCVSVCVRVCECVCVYLLRDMSTITNAHVHVRDHVCDVHRTLLLR
jgi:hypothetical protein